MISPLSFCVRFLGLSFFVTLCQGANLPNTDQPALFEQLAFFGENQSAPLGHGFAGFHRGLLFVPFGGEAGGGGGTGGFTFYDISNPRAPTVAFTTLGNSLYDDPSDADYAGNLREQHTYAFSGDIWCGPGNHNGIYASLQFWDFSDPGGLEVNGVGRPMKLSEIQLSGLPGGNYDGTAWWHALQGRRYVYVAGTTGGLYIVDATDPENPVELKRIPTGSMGNFRINTVFAIGNLLVIAQSDGNGLATFDISDPLNPALLDLITNESVGYSMMVNGGRIYGAHDPARVFSIGESGAITLLGLGPNVADKGGYGMIQDEYFIYGSSSHLVKLDVSGDIFLSAETYLPTGVINPDWDFTSLLGNLLFLSNDHKGSYLLVHDLEADTRGPIVNMVSPYDQATNQRTSSRVGITLTDQVRTETIDQNSFIVRPLGGTALSGTYSNQSGIINFWPDEPFDVDTTYEVILPAGGIQDLAGNGLEETFASTFSTGALIQTINLAIQSSGAAPVTQVVQFEATLSEGENAEFAWDFGDGETLPFSSDSTVTHTYTEPGNYTVKVQAAVDGVIVSKAMNQVIHRQLANNRPSRTSSIVYDEIHGRVWNVNPDNDTVTAIDAETFQKVIEIAVGDQPETLALMPSGELWVANAGDATLSIVDATNLTVSDTLALPRGSKPFGILASVDGGSAWVSLSALGILYQIDSTTKTLINLVEFDPRAEVRSMSMVPDGSELLVTRFISSDSGGEIYSVNPSDGSVLQAYELSIDIGPDTEDSGRGLPNYLGQVAVSPDGSEAWWASKKDNIQRGLTRDGLMLTFESTVRSIAGRLDLINGSEDVSSRIDFNDKGIATAVEYSSLGNYLFVGTQGTHTVEVVDPYRKELVSTINTGGRVVRGIVVSPDGDYLFVHLFMSREVRVFSVGNICGNICQLTQHVATVPTVGAESLSSQVLQGKQIFYDASDSRLNQDQYISCASCHQDGGQDGRVWDFSDRGEGLRNTIDLRGRSGTGHGFVHWSANFDEIQDFEHDIRGPFGGSGLMLDSDFNSGTRNQSLGDPKAGLSEDLDALAAYVSSLSESDKSPYRNEDGSLTDDALEGRILFNELRCGACHNGSTFTDSEFRVLHDVGTLKGTSGNRLGGMLAGIDTPTLIGLWNGAPYLHDGSAPDLNAVLTGADAGGIHTAATHLTESERDRLIAYLLQIESGSHNPPETPLVRFAGNEDGSLFNNETFFLQLNVVQDFEEFSGAYFYQGDTLVALDGDAPYQLSFLMSEGLDHIFGQVQFDSGVLSTAYHIADIKSRDIINSSIGNQIDQFMFVVNPFPDGNFSNLSGRGVYTGGMVDPIDAALELTVGGVDALLAVDLSAGWQFDFNLSGPEELILEFTYLLEVSQAFESNEYGEIRVLINGEEYIGTAIDDFGRIADGGTSGMRAVTIDLGLVPSGDHQLVLGAYVNQKTAVDEFVECRYGDIRLYSRGTPTHVQYADFYDRWLPSEIEPDEDLNGDGVPNVFAYASGAYPDQILHFRDYLWSNFDEEGFGITFRRNPFLYDLRYRVEVSNDLAEWNVLYDSTVDDRINNFGDYLRVNSVEASGLDLIDQQFIRLRVDLIP